MRGEVLEDDVDMGAPGGLSPRSTSSHHASHHGVGSGRGGMSFGLSLGSVGVGRRGYDVVDMGLLGVGGVSSDRMGGGGVGGVDAAYDHELALLYHQQLVSSNGSGGIMSGMYAMMCYANQYLRLR